MKHPKKPEKQAAALKYSGEGAPRLIAKGRGELASQIQKIAQENAIPMVEDTELAAILCELPTGEEIPESLFVAVAEILAFVYQIDQRYPSRVDRHE